VESIKVMRAAAYLLSALTAFAADTPGYDEVARLLKSNNAQAGSAIAAALGEENLKKGTAVLAHGGDFLFAVRSDKPVQVVVDDGSPSSMEKLGASDLYVYNGRYRTGTSHNFYYVTNGARFGGRTDIAAFGPYSYEKPGVPKGTLSEKR